MRVVSLFSGAGGLDLGFKLAGNDIVWANDIDENACATYRENIGDHIVCEDIKDIDIKSIPAADKIVGFTISMYAMVINVVIPATTSCLTFVSFSLSLKNLSIFYLPFLIFR